MRSRASVLRLQSKMLWRSSSATSSKNKQNSKPNRPNKQRKTARKAKNFLRKMPSGAGVKTTASGLQYEVIVQGNGPKPSGPKAKVKVHYRGTLLDGTEFDSSYKRGEPAEFELDQVIKGWSEAVQLMTVGSKYKFYLPPDLAYGDREVGGGVIPPGSTLIFEVELLETN